jgi:hypothetical protein
MIEPERSERFRKDPEREARQRALNELLRAVQDALEKGTGESPEPVVFVMGLPRSASTLLGQLLAAAGLAYISNFVARFWLAPAVAARIEADLGLHQASGPRSFRSTHGTTEGWAEPHEFGYFWDRFFDLGQETHKVPAELLSRVDTGALRRAVYSIQRVSGRPLTFKNNTWCTLQAAFLAQALPRAVFVACRRDPLHAAQSVYLTRLERLGRGDAWWSMRPSSYPDLAGLPWWEQVAAQAVDLDREMMEELARIPAARVVEAWHPRICGEPRSVVAAVQQALEGVGAAFRCDLEALPERFELREQQRIGDAEWRLLRDAVERRLAGR